MFKDINYLAVVYMECCNFIICIFLLFIKILAEINRKINLVEGESELVSRFNVEYFETEFALICNCKLNAHVKAENVTIGID